MKLACLGWGSLVWNPGDLSVGEWATDGPRLPIEFLRVSKNGRVTLVLADGVPTSPSLWSMLDAPSPEAARAALGEREGVLESSFTRSIGLWSGRVDRQRVGQESIDQWASERDLDAVVWTALKPGFPGSRGTIPSAAQLLDHISTLEEPARAKAEEYVRRAPAQIDTAMRRLFEEHLGWMPSE